MSGCGTRGTSEGGDEQEDLQSVVTNLMFAYGDGQEPLDECQKLVMDVLHSQMIAIVKEAEKTARHRGSKKIQMVDVLFQFRRHPAQLNRIFQYLKADVLRSAKQSILNASDMNAESAENLDLGAQFDDGMKEDVKYSLYGRDAQSMYQALSVFDETGELRAVLDRSAKDDEEKMERMRRLFKRGAAMDREEYQKYAKARMCSMCAINGRRSERSIRRFLSWLGGVEVAANTVTILSYIASEIICCIYKKSRIHSAFPVLLLVAYSFFGGLIFYTIECPNEEVLLSEKKTYIDGEKRALFSIISDVEEKVRFIRASHNNTRAINAQLRSYKIFALNRLNKAAYWYALSVYYLTDHESYKASALHPENPEKIWQSHFTTNFGRIHALRNYTEQLSRRCWEIGLELNENSSVTRAKMEDALELFNSWTGLSHVLTPTWTFWNSMFLAVTTYTTIGYGNITAKSRLGKLAAMLYAVIGIPLVLMILHKLGRQCLCALEYFWDCLIRAIEFVWCVKDTARLKRPVRTDSTREANMPLLLAVGVAFGWMFLCAAIFLKFEKDWDYFKSFYFFFCSLTTIGYGDVTPTNSEDMFIIFGFIMVGLSLVSMCINVVQLKLEQLFEELLVMMIEEYRQTGLASPDMKGKIGMMAMWRMWKKKRRQQKENKPKDALSRKPTLAFKRGRQAVLDQLHRALYMVSRGTQTDEIFIGGHLGVVREYEDGNIWSSAVSFPPPTDQIACLGTVSVEDSNSRRPIVVREKERMQIFPQQNSSSGSTSTDKNSLLTLSSSAAAHDGDSSTLTMRHLNSANRATHQLVEELSTTDETDENGSIRSAPTCLVHRTVTGEKFDPSRRWTFIETGKTPRGAPRGLIIPYMFTPQRARQVHTTDMKRLIAEIDIRLKDCRTLAASSSSTIGSSRTASTRTPKPAQL
ncbi:TWiK family of potassium channels protein 18 [Toxocara canis]|uniref:TWiK family of potassium channels protein 18 n=1 Tax=Toxocara canis TaxID=6265 RepID=A0A0B2UNF7_TOXCA|nr:TWiK family of potassium channels protein 18 [Toxocara canis]